MIFRALFLTLTCLAHVLPSAAKVEVYPNFLEAKELQYLTSIPVAADSEGGKTYSTALLDQNVASRIHKVTGVYPSGDSRRSIAITHVGKTTDRHIDAHYGDDGEMKLFETEEKVAFIFLETNPHASFSHGEDIIPSEAGTLVTFEGSTPHNTIINEGSLRIAGAFHLDSLRFIGCIPPSSSPSSAPSSTPSSTPTSAPTPDPNACDEDSDCDDNEECVCFQSSRHQLRKRRAAIELANIHNEVVLNEENEVFDKNFIDSIDRLLTKSKKSPKSSKACDLGGTCILKSAKSSKSPKST